MRRAAAAPKILILIVLCAGICGAQTQISIGYTAPAPTNVAPGQVITVYVAGIEATVGASATNAALGISAVVKQSYGPQGPLPAPVLRVLPVRTCSSTDCAELTGVSVQIPFELRPNIPGAGAPPNLAQLTVSDANGHSASTDLNPVPDEIHILSTADASVSGLQPGAVSVVAHADGKLVTASNPAAAGEELVAYAYGLGTTMPVVAEGQPTLEAAPAAGVPLAINYQFGPNAAPSRGSIPLGSRTLTGSGPSGAPFPAPLFAGLTPGFVGLYQINFLVPTPPPGTVPCGDVITSNLTITFVGVTSFDGAAICTQIPGPSSDNFVPHVMSVTFGADIRGLATIIPEPMGFQMQSLTSKARIVQAP